MKCNQSRQGFDLVSPCPFPTTIAITPWAHFILPGFRFIYDRHSVNCRQLLPCTYVNIAFCRCDNATTNLRGLKFNTELASFCLNPMNLSSRRSQFLLLLTPGYAAGIQRGQVYLQEALHHLRSLRLSLFLLDIVSFLFIFLWRHFLLLDALKFVKGNLRWL